MTSFSLPESRLSRWVRFGKSQADATTTATDVIREIARRNAILAREWAESEAA